MLGVTVLRNNKATCIHSCKQACLSHQHWAYLITCGWRVGAWSGCMFVPSWTQWEMQWILCFAFFKPPQNVTQGHSLGTQRWIWTESTSLAKLLIKAYFKFGSKLWNWFLLPNVRIILITMSPKTCQFVCWQSFHQTHAGFIDGRPTWFLRYLMNL